MPLLPLPRPYWERLAWFACISIPKVELHQMARAVSCRDFTSESSPSNVRLNH